MPAAVSATTVVSATTMAVIAITVFTEHAELDAHAGHPGFGVCLLHDLVSRSGALQRCISERPFAEGESSVGFLDRLYDMPCEKATGKVKNWAVWCSFCAGMAVKSKIS
jgi:hypothetical protein